MKTPEYSIQKGKGRGDRAYVKLNSVKHYLGIHNSPESHEKYRRIIAEFYSNGGTLPPNINNITISELCCLHNRHAKQYYTRADGTETSEVGNYKRLAILIATLYATLPVSDFSPIHLETVRNTMIDKGWTRISINNQINKVRTIISFGVSKGLVDVNVLNTLKTLKFLAKGRSKALELKAIKTIPQEHIDPLQPHVSNQIWAMIQLQILTGARPTEICIMRRGDIDMTKDDWIYTPSAHKTEHHGKKRLIPIGPKAKEVLNKYIIKQPFNYLFSPTDAQNDKNVKAKTHRRPNQQKNINSTDRVIGNRYTVHSYRRAIHRACEKMGIPSWSPNRLRHNYATFISNEYGLETARIMLGHSKVSTTQIYAEDNFKKAIEIAREIG